MQELIGRLVSDPNGRDELLITGFRRDGKVSLTNVETGVNTQMPLADVIALENDAEASGLIQRNDRATCPVCEDWNVADHEHSWLDGVIADPDGSLKIKRARLQSAVDAAVEAMFVEVA